MNKISIYFKLSLSIRKHIIYNALCINLIIMTITIIITVNIIAINIIIIAITIVFFTILIIIINYIIHLFFNKIIVVLKTHWFLLLLL
jgi:hypothetical protein